MWIVETTAFWRDTNCRPRSARRRTLHLNDELRDGLVRQYDSVMRLQKTPQCDRLTVLSRPWELGVVGLAGRSPKSLAACSGISSRNRAEMADSEMEVRMRSPPRVRARVINRTLRIDVARHAVWNTCRPAALEPGAPERLARRSFRISLNSATIAGRFSASFFEILAYSAQVRSRSFHSAMEDHPQIACTGSDQGQCIRGRNRAD